MGRKIPGLTPNSIIRQMQEAANGKSVRSVRGRDKKDGPVLSETREAATDQAGAGGIFGSPEGSGSGSPPVPDASGDTGGEASFRTQLSRVLKRLLGESPPPAMLQDLGLTSATNAELLAAVIQREAFAGKQWACEMWRDMTEGKPVRAAQMNNSEMEIEANLDRLTKDKLNSYTEKGT